MSSRPIEALAVAAAKDWALTAFTDGQVDSPWSAGHEGDDRGLVAFAEDPQRSMAALDSEVLMLVAHASETRNPFKPGRTARAAWSWS